MEIDAADAEAEAMAWLEELGAVLKASGGTANLRTRQLLGELGLEDQGQRVQQSSEISDDTLQESMVPAPIPAPSHDS